MSLLGSNGRSECNMKNVSISELASVLLCDVSKLGVASSCTRRDISILEGIVTGLLTFHCAQTS